MKSFLKEVFCDTVILMSDLDIENNFNACIYIFDSFLSSVFYLSFCIRLSIYRDRNNHGGHYLSR